MSVVPGLAPLREDRRRLSKLGYWLRLIIFAVLLQFPGAWLGAKQRNGIYSAHGSCGALQTVDSVGRPGLECLVLTSGADENAADREDDHLIGFRVDGLRILQAAKDIRLHSDHSGLSVTALRFTR
jgi:hypothetical protein